VFVAYRLSTFDRGEKEVEHCLVFNGIDDPFLCQTIVWGKVAVKMGRVVQGSKDSRKVIESRALRGDLYIPVWEERGDAVDHSIPGVETLFLGKLLVEVLPFLGVGEVPDLL